MGREAATVSFIVPADWEKTSVSGDQNFWLRFRLSSGDFGGLNQGSLWTS